MNGTAIARIAKVCALLGFFMPWAMVSCSGQPISSRSGISLAMGETTTTNPVSGAMEHAHLSPNLWLILALVAIVGGLALSFMGRPPKQTARILLVSALVAAALSVVGVSSFFASRGQEIAKAQTENAGDVAGLIQIRTRYGFWVTLVSLAVAAAASGLVLSNRGGTRESS
jgi:hypothetical protein